PPTARPGERPGVVPLRPLGLGELLDGAVAVVRGYWRPVFAAGAVVAVVGAVLDLVVVLTFLRPVLDLDPEQVGTSLSSAVDALAGVLVGGFVSAAFATTSAELLVGLVAPAVSRGALGQPLSGREAWEQLRPRLGPLIAVAVLVPLLALLVGLLGFVLTGAAAAVSDVAAGLVGILAVPAGLALGVHLYVRWSLAPACVVLERAGPRAALRRSSGLVRRSWWRVLGILLLSWIIAALVSQVLQVPFLALRGNPLEVFTGADTSTPAFVLQAVGQAVAATVVGPFVAAVRVLLYVDRRMRAEGLDVALAAAAAREAR
ncbi:MAG: hypothetical protein M3P46_10980, partial [Actinomycetota bacterium]|nr:hypothetical protein [Actinomycetota bacterium]